MKAVIIADKLKGVLSPYLAKKALESVYVDPNFAYVIDKIIFVQMPKVNKDGEYVNGRYLVSFHVKSTQRVGKPVVVKPVESHIRSLILTYDCSASLQIEGQPYFLSVTKPTDKDGPAEITCDLGELELSKEITKSGKMVMKVVKGVLEDGVLDLKALKPYIRKSKGKA